MSESKQVSRPSIASREILGMVLFTASAFPLVLVAMALTKGQAEATGGTATIAASIVDAIGYVPAIVAAGGFAIVGAGMALSGKDLEVGRHLSGFLFTALGLAICLGALHAGGEGKMHAGSFGDATGGALLALGPWTGLVIGGAIAFSAVWLAWLGGLEQAGTRFRGNGGQTPTISDALSERDADGVSSAEANALVPDEATLSYMEELWSADSAPQPEPIPPSPYPEDVRLQGEIPEGAAALKLDDDEEAASESHLGAPSWRPAAADRPAEHGAGDDLASDATLPAALPGGAEREPVGIPEAQLENREVRVLEDVPPPSQAGPPVPAWEQEAQREEPSVATAAVEDEPEVDGDEPEAELETEELEEAELEEDEELVAESGLEEEDDEEEEPEAAELEDDEEEEAAELEEEEEEDEAEEAAELDEEEGEEDEELEEAAELEEDAEDEYEEDDDEEYEEAAELDDEEEEDEDVEEDEAAELEEAELEEDEEAELEDEEEAELEEDEYEDEEVAAEDDDDEVVAEDVEEPEPALEAEEEAIADSEPEVVLQPAAPPEGVAATGELEPVLIHEAGRLFLSHGRVAVSLLQRRFGLEFDDACEVLDELQEMGLIGPYMGGQKRDILLTPEEWEGRLAGS